MSQALKNAGAGVTTRSRLQRTFIAAPIRWLVVGGVVVAPVVVAVASVATWIPARRAAGVDPLIAIRVE